VFSIIYYFLAVVLYVVALPLLVYLSFKQKYAQSVPARFFLRKNGFFTEQNPLWFHVCSLGEARALKPLLEKLNQRVDITTITQTGNEEAQKYNADVRYLPYEIFLPFWVTPHKVLVVLEAEFWYMLFLMARKKGAKIVLLNARISDNSYEKYKKMAWFYKKIFANVHVVFAQSQKDKVRLEELGAKEVHVVGNIKLAAKISQTKFYDKPSSEVIVAGSTHETEEEPIIESFLRYKKNNNAKLIVVPRHPERFKKVHTLMQHYAQKENLTLSRWSEKKTFDADLILVDAMGELNNMYAIADVAILGGAFRDDVGGHNPLEPAHFGCKVISGEYFFHQKALFKEVKNIQIVAKEKIYEALNKAKKTPSASYDGNVDLESILQKLRLMV
jgi:3-deoxy-D-manno-octulosonic-acid transferase